MSSVETIRTIEEARGPSDLGIRLGQLKRVGENVVSKVFTVADSTRAEDLHAVAHRITAENIYEVVPPMTPPEQAMVTDYAVAGVLSAHDTLLGRLNRVTAAQPIAEEGAQ